ncbi:hypothetical protein [Acidianus sp. RZ1]|uniref:hypothetical protein n=1 Tax=Acidianus sp. RZ1 TaxID=1540082 RepID=UPI0014911281|nr:hypothetical protein [Acidianus sp. RZ1]NON62749.1 hypothetical protein [Acidianus sp. RZ1]
MIKVKGLSINCLNGVNLELGGISCILGNWGKDKESLISAILGKEKYQGKVEFYVKGVLIDNKEARMLTRVIPQYMEKPNVKASSFLYPFTKVFGGKVKEIMQVLDIEDKYLSEMGDYELFKVYSAPLFMGDVKFILLANLLNSVEEQAKARILKDLIKISKMKNSDLILLIDSAEYVNVCESLYVIYGGRILEEGKEFLHPYSMALLNSRIKMGNKHEKIDVMEIGQPTSEGCPFHEFCNEMKLRKYLWIKCRLEMPDMMNIGEEKVACWLFREEFRQ